MPASSLKKNNVHVIGNLDAAETLVFAHGFGSDQTVWRFITPAFEDQYRLVLFDMVGCGESDLEAFNSRHYTSLHDFANDLIQLCDSLNLKGVHLIAHSASSMVGTLATLKRPDLFATLVFIGASPHYLNEDGYIGGFTRDQVSDLINQMGENYTHWLCRFAANVVDAPDRPELVDEFAGSLANMRPDIAIWMANKIFLSDHRQDISQLKLPVLLIQSRVDAVVPPQVSEYLHHAIPNSQLHWISTPGHFPHLSQPDEITKTIAEYLG